jgi:D-3-phosphoglycerate dehydrogenase
MVKGICVDKNYGSVSSEEFALFKREWAGSGIDLEMEDFHGEDAIIAGCKDADFLMCAGNPPITEKILKALPKVKLVHRMGVGFNSVDIAAATRLGRVVGYLPGYPGRELAFHAAGMMLSLIRNLGFYDRHIRAGGWPKARYFVPREPQTMTFGIFGFGNSGRPLYHIIHDGFGAKVVVCDPYVDKKELTGEKDACFVSFDEMLRQADVISIHTPLNEETRHIFNMKAFKAMKKDAMLINVARGGIVNEEDLIQALQTREIRFAGLDVFEKEPLPEDSPLKKMDNVILSCHAAFHGEGSCQKRNDWTIRLIKDFFGARTIHKVYVANPDVLPKLSNIHVVEGKLQQH